ncbi:MAG: hypothetical protein Q7S12_00350 [bacterium]|nr:hypothetical protein [bacterium]
MLARRSAHNPILKPDISKSWESEAVFNGCPVKKDGKVHLLYRAMSAPHFHALAETNLSISTIGIADSKDGEHFSNRRIYIEPSEEWDMFGCEDPRVTKLGNKYYTFYTALSLYPFRAEGIKVGVAISKDLKTPVEKHPVTPFNAKAFTLFPEKIGGKIWAALTVNTDKAPAHICWASFDKEEDIWNKEKWEEWYKNFEKYSYGLQRRPQDHIEVGAPPFKTKKGWVLLYSYIRNYGSPNQVFGVEAILLDPKDPSKINCKISTPIIVPEEYYEKSGMVPNIVFPSGVIVKNDNINLYYGAADVSCCLAVISLKKLERRFLCGVKPIYKLWQNEKEILRSVKEHSWESRAVFNPASIYLGDKMHLIYRAFSEDNTSTMGYASSKNGIDIDYRAPDPVYVPRETFEQKSEAGRFSGCEDPRLTKIGNRIYMCYTAYNGGGPPRIALTSISDEDFLAQKWDWKKPVLISAPGIDNKDACIFPEKINGKYVIIHRLNGVMDLSYSKTLDFDGNTWLEEERWVFPRQGMWDSKKVGISAPPIRTKKGWLVLYHGVSDEGIYRVGALLTKLDDPTKIIARTDEAIFEPREKFELEGQVPNVVFPCGASIVGDTLFMYYGGADQSVGVATIPTNKLMALLEKFRY